MSHRTVLVLVVCVGAVVVAAGAGAPKSNGPAAGSASAPAASPGAPGDVYARLMAAYMDGRMDDVETELRTSGAQVLRLPQAQQADVAYLRQAMAECRPPWWRACKAGRKTVFQAEVWGRKINAAYDPAGKGGMQCRPKRNWPLT